ncbi:MAG: hypothetical protein M9927_11350 [Anaerolineae bacterium]|nr:hypothetical protein [Anaerolineae bacterium]
MAEGVTTPTGPSLGARLTHITRNTLLVTFLFGLAAVAGLFRNIIVAQEFGIGAALDAYYAAFKLPDLLFAVVAGGALATAFIPIFADFLTDGDRPGAWRLAAAITNLVVIVVGVLASIAWIFAPWLVSNLIAPGFPPPAQAETVQVMRIVLFSTVLFGISAVQGSALNGFKHFFLPALAPVVYPLGIAAGAILLAPTMGVTGLAIGAVFGSLLHLLIKVPGLIKFGYRWWPVLDLKSQAVRRVLMLLGPRVLDLFVFQFTLIMTTNLASRLGAGGVSSVEWGWDAMQLPETLIGTAFGLVAFPTMAELAARRDIAGLRSTLGETLRWVIALALPATVGLILLAGCYQPLPTRPVRRQKPSMPSTRHCVSLRWGWWRELETGEPDGVPPRQRTPHTTSSTSAVTICWRFLLHGSSTRLAPSHASRSAILMVISARLGSRGVPPPTLRRAGQRGDGGW